MQPCAERVPFLCDARDVDAKGAEDNDEIPRALLQVQYLQFQREVVQ